MSEPDIQIQRDYPQTLVNSQWVKWAAERIAELEQQLAKQVEFSDNVLFAAKEYKKQLAELREALTYISTTPNAYGVRRCRDVAEEALQGRGE